MSGFDGLIGRGIGGSQDITGNAATVTVADESTDTTCFVGFFTAATGTLPIKTGTNLTFDSSTGILTATGFAGALNGTVGATTPAAGSFTTGVFSTSVTLTGTAGAVGIDINPGSDTDADLITVGVTGAPKLWWDESATAFAFNTDVILPATNKFYFDGGTHTYITEGTNDRMDFYTGATRKLQLGNTGEVFVGAPGNDNITIGLSINMGANDDQIICGKSSDIATVLTTATTQNVETDDFVTLSKIHATNGGLLLQSLALDAALTNALRFSSYGGTADTTKSTSGRALVEVYVSEHDGANTLANITANGNVFGVIARRGGSDVALALLDEDADLWLGGALSTTEVATPSIAVDNATEGGTAQMTTQSVQEVVTLTGAATKDTTIAIPNGSLLLGASFCVNTAVVDDGGDDTWSAAYITGAVTALAAAAAAAKQTKVDTLVVPEVASDVTEIQFSANGGDFTAGVIEVVAYYVDLTSLANAA